jgi:hypothetical protein
MSLTFKAEISAVAGYAPRERAILDIPLTL